MLPVDLPFKFSRSSFMVSFFGYIGIFVFISLLWSSDMYSFDQDESTTDTCVELSQKPQHLHTSDQG